MIMVMAGVTVGSYHHFKAVTPQLLRQLDANLMGNLRCDLIGLEGLIAVEADTAPILSRPDMRGHSFFVSIN